MRPPTPLLACTHPPNPPPIHRPPGPATAGRAGFASALHACHNHPNYSRPRHQVRRRGLEARYGGEVCRGLQRSARWLCWSAEQSRGDRLRACTPTLAGRRTQGRSLRIRVALWAPCMFTVCMHHLLLQCMSIYFFEFRLLRTCYVLSSPPSRFQRCFERFINAIQYRIAVGQ